MKPIINDAVSTNVSEKAETENALTAEYLSETRPGATKVRPAGDSKPSATGGTAGAAGDTPAGAASPPTKISDAGGQPSHSAQALAGGSDGRPPLERPNGPGSNGTGIGAGAAGDGAVGQVVADAIPGAAHSPDLGDVGNHGAISAAKIDEIRKEEKHQTEIRQEAVNLVQGGSLDTNHDGFVTRNELHTAAINSTREKPQTDSERVKLGMKQDAINYMLDNFAVIQGASHDEWGPENDGITGHDIRMQKERDDKNAGPRPSGLAFWPDSVTAKFK